MLAIADRREYLPRWDETFHLHDAERVTVQTLTPELLEVAAEWDPADHRPPPHLHPSQDERFAIDADASDPARRHPHAGGDRAVAAQVPSGVPAGAPGTAGAHVLAVLGLAARVRGYR